LHILPPAAGVFYGVKAVNPHMGHFLSPDRMICVHLRVQRAKAFSIVPSALRSRIPQLVAP
jgi:hypothetical protein